MPNPVPRVVLALALALAVLGAGSAAAVADPRPAPSYRLSAMSYNIHHGVGEDDVLDLERVARVIEDSGADVVALQEVDRHWARSGDVDQAEWLGRRLRMRVVFGANLDLAPEPGGSSPRQYGTALLSRYPITSAENHLLTSIPYPDRPTEQRGLLHAELEVRGTAVDVWSTHLDHQRTEQRLSQVREILDLTDQTPERPGLLMGDLNAQPDAEEMQLLTDGPFADPFAASGAEGWTYPAQEPDARIDYVLGRGVTGWADPVVLDTLASDHRPVLVDAEVPRAARG